MSTGSGGGAQVGAGGAGGGAGTSVGAPSSGGGSGGDPFGPLIASLDALDKTLAGVVSGMSVTAVLDTKPLENALYNFNKVFGSTLAVFHKSLDNTFSSFTKAFDTSLIGFVGNFTTAFATSISNLSAVLATINTGGGGGGGGGRGGRRVIPRNRPLAQQEAEKIARGDNRQTGNEAMVKNVTAARNDYIQTLADKKTATITITKAVEEILINTGFKAAKIKPKTLWEKRDDVIKRDVTLREIAADTESMGYGFGPLNWLQPKFRTAEEKAKADIKRDLYNKESKIIYNKMAPSMGLPLKGVPVPKGFDWKGMAGGAGLGILFASAGAGIGLLVAKLLGPVLRKGFDPLIKATEDTISALDPFAEAINTSLAPLREFGNEVKRWSIVAGMAASFNMKRTNAEAGGNLNNLLADNAKMITGIFSSPMTGIMAAADAIGKFVEMADPAAMAVYQQTMRDTFAVIGNALKPAMIELTKMFRMFADDFNVVLQNAIPTIVISLNSLAEAFRNNLPNIIVLMERYVQDLAKMAGSASGQTDWKRLDKGYQEFVAGGMKVDRNASYFAPPPKISTGYGAPIIPYSSRQDSDSEAFEKYFKNAQKISGSKLTMDSPEGLAWIKKIIDAGVGTKKSPSTVGMARPENAAYGNVADVGREAVRRAFEGSRQQDLLRQQNRDDTREGTKQGVIEGLTAVQSNKSSPIFQRNGRIPWSPPDHGDNFGGLGQYTKDPAFIK